MRVHVNMFGYCTLGTCFLSALEKSRKLNIDIIFSLLSTADFAYTLTLCILLTISYAALLIINFL